MEGRTTKAAAATTEAPSPPPSLFSFRAAFGPPAGSAPDALALSGVRVADRLRGQGGRRDDKFLGRRRRGGEEEGAAAEEEEEEEEEGFLVGSPFSGVAVASGAAAAESVVEEGSEEGEEKETVRMAEASVTLGAAEGSEVANREAVKN